MYNQLYNQQQQIPGAAMTSQYRGVQKAFQPSGPVQSFYGQTQQAQQLQPQAYHMANYRGNQLGHDAYLTTEYQPVSQFGQNQPQLINQYQAPVQNQYQQGQYQNQNPQSFHTANYRGDQLGHDEYLRADHPIQGQYQGNVQTIPQTQQYQQQPMRPFQPSQFTQQYQPTSITQQYQPTTQQYQQQQPVPSQYQAGASVMK